MMPRFVPLSVAWVMKTRSPQTVGDAVPEGHPEDAEVEPGVPVRDVVEVVLDALAKRSVAAPAVDLGPASDARLDAVTRHVIGDGFAELLDEDRPLRPRAHQAHVAAEHIDELRKLVEAGAAQECAPARSPRVV